jgi:hypothetical protein
MCPADAAASPETKEINPRGSKCNAGGGDRGSCKAGMEP